MRRSTVTTAGSLTRSVATPPSTSRPTRSAPCSSLIVAVDGLLAHEHDVRLLSLHQRLERAGHEVAVELVVGRVHAERLVRARRERGPERLLRLLGAEGHHHDLAGPHLGRLAVLGQAE